MKPATAKAIALLQRVSIEQFFNLIANQLMKLPILKTLAIILLFPLSSYANENPDEYHFDSDLSYTGVDNKYFYTNNWKTSLKYYWDPISYASDYPNKEAVFVNRLGSVGVQYRGSFFETYFQKELRSGIDAELIYAAKDFNHVFQFGYSWDNVATTLFSLNDYFDDDYKLDLNMHHLNFRYQYYLLDNLTLGASFKLGIFDDFFINDATYTYGIDSKYLLNLGNSSWLALKASYQYADIYEDISSHSISASAEYYFSAQTSLELGGGVFISDEFSEIYTVGNIDISITHYVIDQFSVYAGIRNRFNGGGNAQHYNVGINYRF